MKLIDYLPAFYRESGEVAALQGALESQTRALWEAKDGLFDQLDLSRATWGLAYWERALGLDVDVSRPAEFRRTRVLSKLRGQGTTTAAMIQNVAESFSNGKVDVIERPGEYRFDVKFTGTIGVPPNMEDLTAAIEELKPAHLDYDYIILFRTWDMVRNMTWDEAGAYTWDELREGALS